MSSLKKGLTKVRTYQTYLDKIQKKAKTTQKNFINSYNHFGRFCKAKHGLSVEEIIQEMKIAEPEAVFDTLQEWVNWAKLSPSTLPVYFTNIKSYLYYRGVKVTNMDVKENIDFPKIHQEELHPLSNEEFNKILSVASYNNQVFYLCQSSAGLRPVELCNIRKRDLELDKKTIIVHVPAKFTKLKRARTTFFSSESSKKLRPLLRNIADNDLIFGSKTNARDWTFG